MTPLQRLLQPQRLENESYQEYEDRRKGCQRVIRASQNSNYVFKSVLVQRDSQGDIVTAVGKTYTNPEKNSFKIKSGHKREKKALKRFRIARRIDRKYYVDDCRI